MGAGRVRIKRYKTRRGKKGWLVLPVLLLAGAIWAVYSGQDSLRSLLIAPAPTLSPAESQADARTVTLSGKTWYALQLGAIEKEESARVLAESFRERGAGALVEHRENYRVLAAAYESRAEAQQVQNQLRSQHGVEVYISEISRKEITLKISGQKAQLTALTDAYDALAQAELQLSALSQGMDRGETTRETALSALRSQRDTLSALHGRLLSLFGENAHAAVEQVMALLSSLETEIASALKAESALALGAGIKYCQLLVITGLAAYGEGLAAP